MAEAEAAGWFDESVAAYGDFERVRFPYGETDNFNVPADTREGVSDPAGITPWQRWRQTMLAVGKTEISLVGKTYVQLQSEAARIKLGSNFESMEDFQFAMDCWSVYNSRINKHWKTRENYYVRTCIFGFPMRPDPPTRKRNGEIVHRCTDKENQQPNMESRSFSEFTQRRPSQCAVVGGTDLNEEAGLSDTRFEVGVRPRKVRKVPTVGACGQVVRHQSAGPFSEFGAELEPTECSKEKGPVDSDLHRCEWRVRCQRGLKSGVFQITVCNLQHTCPGHLHSWRGPCQNAQHLALLMCNRVVLDPNVPCGRLVNDFRQTFEKRTTYHATYRMREKVRDWIQGGQTKSFYAIPALCRKMQEVDSECVVEYGTWSGSGIFKRVFVCPSACRHALLFSQKVITLDACHTKNKKYPSQIFTASCSDGNNQSIILCFAVAASEDEETWTWFCTLMRRSIIGMGQKHIVILSDRCKGLLSAVKNVLPEHIHGHCSQHLRTNVKVRFGKDAEKAFWSCVYARKEAKFTLILDNLKSSGRSGFEAAAYIRKIPAHLWARCQFPLPRYGKVASNVAESVNAALKPIREFAPFRVVTEMWTYMMETFAKRNVDARVYGVLTPFAQFRFDENERVCGQFICHVSSDDTALVQKTGAREQYVVHHGNVPCCECLELQEMLWPCAHSIVWDREFSRDPMRNIDSVWFSKTLRRIYARSIPPLVTTDLMLAFGCGPPPVALRRGRHRVVRIPSGGAQCRGNEGRVVTELEYPLDEDPVHQSHMLQTDLQQDNTHQTQADVILPPTGPLRTRHPSSKQGQRRCSICKALGHNIRTCPQRAVVRGFDTTQTDTHHPVPEVVQGEETMSTTGFQQDSDGHHVANASDEDGDVPVYNIREYEFEDHFSAF